MFLPNRKPKTILAKTGAIQGTSPYNVYQELGLESLKLRR